ncbi:hypothetical protein [Bradyrhizobium elkanii]|uniref:hypothetical protein n=1 Tax=Bradyrhizobium elkanii TaxID=29448 RepID=UPI002166C729|nr:hypothetical protein [Bradyrhizobium elkanii]MCS3690978.1 hypothetical protein [Bradyrhizobium elkanii]
MTAINAKKSYKDGHVSVRVVLNARGWQSDSVKVEGTTDLTTAQARDLAKSLISEADRADAKIAKKAASDERRKKWRDREVAAGRLKMVELGSLLGGRHG